MGNDPIFTEAAPKPIGPYSQAIRSGEWLFCSGQGAMDPKTGALVTDSVAVETEQTLRNLGNVLRAAGFDYADVVKTTVFLVDMNDFAEMNAVYAKYFDSVKPARSTVAVKALPRDIRVEIEAIARKPDA
jgi:2-iminobutanoate/2-iminopropanoate deaminase